MYRFVGSGATCFFFFVYYFSIRRHRVFRFQRTTFGPPPRKEIVCRSARKNERCSPPPTIPADPVVGVRFISPSSVAPQTGTTLAYSRSTAGSRYFFSVRRSRADDDSAYDGRPRPDEPPNRNLNIGFRFLVVVVVGVSALWRRRVIVDGGTRKRPRSRKRHPGLPAASGKRENAPVHVCHPEPHVDYGERARS